MKRIDELVAEARRTLAGTRCADPPFEVPGREAALLVGHALGLSEAQVLARGDRPVGASEVQRVSQLLARRVAAEPMAYLTGEREFYGRSFQVDRRVLIPRPETEHLVEAALALPLGPRPRFLDLGTGSGAIAVTLAAERPEATVVATDLSPAALAVTALNARRHGVDRRLRLVAADLADPLTDVTRFSAVVSNPPYIDPRQAKLLSPEVRDQEPALALFAGEEGLAIYRRLFELAERLARGAYLAIEIGDGQLEGVRAFAGSLELVEVVDDYAGKPRTMIFRRG